MKHMLNQIDQHFEEVKLSLNFVQLHFFEKKYIIDRPLMTEKIFLQMAKSHFIGLQQFSPSNKLKNTCIRTSLGLCAIVGQGIIFPGQVIHRRTEGWFIPWGVYITLPEQNQLRLKQNRQQTLLYCPITSENSNELMWFEKEDASNALTHKLLTCGSYYNENEILKQNLQQDPCPLYEEAIKDWYKYSITDNIAKTPRKLNKTNFAPRSGQTVEQAYGAIIKSTRERTSQHLQNLRFRYRIKLEHRIFTNLSWTGKEKIAFLEKLEASILGLQSPVSIYGKQGRWKQDEGIDCYTAANFIEFFVLKFIANPKDYQSGEIACILWILIGCAQSGGGDSILIEQVRNLTTKQLKENQIIHFKNVKLKISQGLYQFLLCLCGKGTGKRSHPLFRNIDKKTLERSLRYASKKILPKGVTPVLPAAFLISPHLHPGVRICGALRKVMKETRQLVPHRYMSGEIKEILKSTIAKRKSKDP